MSDSARLPKTAYFALGLAMTAIVGYVDSLTPDALMSFFYLIPIVFVSWFCGNTYGFSISAISVVGWFYVDITTGTTVRPFVHYWNTFEHLGIFFATNVFVSLLLQQRRVSEKEREVSELKSNLVSLVSHEFGNMLTIFRLGLTNLMESEDAAPSAERLQHYSMLERVYTHLSSATANFLNLNRIESGRFIPHIRKTSLLTQVHSVIALQSTTFESKRIALTTAIPPGPVFVAADPDALTVVLVNLIGNAIKYTPNSGSVSVRVVLELPDEAFVTIEDTGIGISKEELPLIASRYYRTKDGQRAAKGYGVGLRVVHDLLENQNSRLEIDSTPGKGSRFSFRLPLWHEQAHHHLEQSA